MMPGKIFGIDLKFAQKFALLISKSVRMLRTLGRQFHGAKTSSAQGSDTLQIIRSGYHRATRSRSEDIHDPISNVSGTIMSRYHNDQVPYCPVP